MMPEKKNADIVVLANGFSVYGYADPDKNCSDGAASLPRE